MRAIGSVLGMVGLLACSCFMGCSSEETGTGGGGSGGAGGSGGMDGGTGGAPPPSGAIAGPVTRYDYVFDAGALSADTKVTLDVQAPGGDCLDLESLVEPSGEVTWNDEAATGVSADGTVLHVCGQGLAGGALAVRAPTVFPKKTYYGLDVGFSVKTDMDGGKFSYLLSWVGGCDSFGPCDDDPGTVAEMHFDVAHEAGAPVLCPGVRTAGETSTHCDVQGTLAPTYSGVAWASDPLWVEKPFLTAAGVDWVFFEVPSGNIMNSLDPGTMGDFFEWITGVFGPFPYGKELRFAGGPTKWLGFEHPANIVLFEGLGDLPTSYANSAAHVTMHEITHQWAGDRVTIATSGDFVWKEATAEYMPYVFEDEMLGADIAAADLAYWDAISLQAAHYPRPTDDPLPHVSKFYGDVYGPGPMVLYVQLEGLIGREAVLAGIQAFLKEPGARSVDELRMAMEAASGKDLKPYFDVWVFGTGAPEWPTMKVETTQDPATGEVTVTVTQVNKSGKLYGCVAEVDVKGASQTVTAVVDFGIDPKSATATGKVMLPGEDVVSTELDPRHRLVAREMVTPAVAEEPRKVWIF